MENTNNFRDVVTQADLYTESTCNICSTSLAGQAVDRDVWNEHSQQIQDAIVQGHKAKAQELKNLREQYHLTGLVCPSCSFTYCSKKHNKELGYRFWSFQTPDCPRCGSSLDNSTLIFAFEANPEITPETRKKPVLKQAKKPLSERMEEHYDELDIRGRVSILGIILMPILGFLGFGIGNGFYVLIDAILNCLQCHQNA